ncbi:MAG TPA: dTMP kinase [Leucothrix mucor]|nr:dTMP kinase [Leucothrix mucor]
MSGVFISFEGVEGGGKTTNIHFIAESLKVAGKKILLTREPGGTEVSEAIREVLLSKDLPAMHQDTELLLMFAARAEHLQKKILPALAQDTWVLCDRFTDASYAYQGGGRGIAEERIALLESWVQGECRPDYTFLFDLDAETGLSRVRSRGETDRIEQESIDFFNRIRDKYLEMAQQYSHRYRVINAQHPLPQVQQQVSDTLYDILSNHPS